MIVLGIVLATIVSFLASAILYALPPAGALMSRSSTPRPGIPAPAQMILVVLRSLVTAAMVAGIMMAAGWHGAASGVLLGLGLVPLPAMLLLGGVIHESTPIPLAGLHLLDWTMKLAIIGALVGAFI
jgi:hypothetical protein